MPNEGFIWAAYLLTWLVVIPFTWMTLGRVRRAERTARGGEAGSRLCAHGAVARASRSRPR